MFKFVSLRKFKLAHHKWQKDEEQLLTRIIKYYWVDLVKLAHQTGSAFLKDFFRKARTNASFALLSSAVSIGVAI
jgi:hypothetical protein